MFNNIYNTVIWKATNLHSGWVRSFLCYILICYTAGFVFITAEIDGYKITRHFLQLNTRVLESLSFAFNDKRQVAFNDKRQAKKNVTL